MSIQDSKRVSDGFLTLEGGMDSGLAPSLIGLNQCSFAVNTTFRGGWPTARPGLSKINVDFTEGSTGAFFQGAGTLTDNDGNARLVYSIGGRLWSINISQGFLLEEFTPVDSAGAPDRNNPNNRHAWFQEAENMVIVQDNQAKPVIWNAAVSRRANDQEVPVGGPMAYGNGRLSVARGSEYVLGDLVWSHPGEGPTIGRNSILQFTENTFLNEGGAFAVPGIITGMAYAANLDTTLGAGDQLIFTQDSAFAFNAPVDRTTWKDLQAPIQRVALLGLGSFNHEGIVPVNGDLFFRSENGILSIIYARRDFSEWGNTPISRQVDRVLKYDSHSLLSATSAVNFDNRMLMTIQPILDQRYGIWHRGMVALDFHMVAGMGQKLPPAWEGAWDGIKILHMLTQRVNGVVRCFIFALGCNGQLELWELTRGNPFDFDGTNDVRITWILETRSMTMGNPSGQKKIQGADHWYDGLLGDLTVKAYYNHDNAELWTPWAQWTDFAQYRDCADAIPPDCQVVKHYRAQTKTRICLPKPQQTDDVQNAGFTDTGYEFQVRYEFTGRMRFKRLNLFADTLSEPIYGTPLNVTCLPQPVKYCLTGSMAVDGCDLPNYNYSANQVICYP